MPSQPIAETPAVAHPVDDDTIPPAVDDEVAPPNIDDKYDDVAEPKDDEYDDVAPPKDDDYDLLAAQEACADARRKFKKGKFKKSSKTDSELQEEFDSLIPFDSSDEEEEEGAQIPAGRPTVPDPSSPSSPSLRIIKSRGTGMADKVQLSGGAWVTNYEYQRLLQMGKNKSMLRAQGLFHAEDMFKPPPSQRRARVQVTEPSEPSRILPARLSKSLPKS